jgi:5-methylcytosine-specific restriction endonuclease McrA
MGTVRQKRRIRIAIRDEWTCSYCRTELDERTLAVDHVHPRSKGGWHEEENLVACCKLCNSYKKDLVLEDFYEKAIRRQAEAIESAKYWSAIVGSLEAKLE